MPKNRPSPPLKIMSGAVFLAAAYALLPLPPAGIAAQGPETDPTEPTRAALEKWIEIRRLIAREKQDWALGRELLANRIDLVKRESETLRSRIADVAANLHEADKKMASLTAENSDLIAEAKTVLEAVGGLERRTLELVPKLPTPIRNRIEPLKQRVPVDPAATKLSAGVRFQNVVGILNEINKFNREISLTSEILSLGEGVTAEVTVLYIGLSHGFYLGADGKSAGTGRAGGKGWIWRSANESAREIAAAIAILKNERPAEFVYLPVVIE